MNEEDRVRADFLFDLDEAAVEVSDWEAEFIESNLRYEETTRVWFSDKQRLVIDKMMDKYESKL